MSIQKMYLSGFAMVLLLILLSFQARPALAHMVPLTDRQLVHSSEHIVVAVVEEVRSRWNSQHTLIFTDYELRIEDRLKGHAPARITLSMPGGTLDGETHDTCLSTPLVKSGRYLLFLGDLAHPTLAATTGAQQGVFREVQGPNGKRFVAAGSSDAVLTMEGRRIEFKDFVEAMRSFAARVEANPEPGDTPAKGRSGENPDLPSKTYDPSARPPGRFLLSAAPSLERAEVPGLPWTDQAEAGVAETSSSRLLDITGKYVYQGRPPAPIVFDNFPAGFSFAPYDQYQMAYWNVYAKNLFRVLVSPSSTWAFGNGV